MASSIIRTEPTIAEPSTTQAKPRAGSATRSIGDGSPTRRGRTRRHAVLGVALAATMALAGCAGDDALGGSSATSQAAGATNGAGGKALTVGGADFSEMQVMEQMYKLLLEKAGYTVDIKTAGQREIYTPSLEKGDIDVVPEYAATMAEYLNKAKNGSDAKPISSNDAAATVAAMKPLAQEKGLTLLKPTKAANQNGFYVTKKFADENKVTTLSEYAALKKATTIAAGDECTSRPFCAVGLKNTYGIDVKGVTGDGFGSASGKQKVLNGGAQLGLAGTTDGTLEGLGLVMLTDDKRLQAADNIVPVVNTASASDPAIASALDSLADTLTTEDLAALNAQVDGERKKPEDVAKQYLEDKKLL